MAIDLSFGSTLFPRAQEVRELLYESGDKEPETTRQRQLQRLADFFHGEEYTSCQLSWDGYPADQVDALSTTIVPYGNVQPAADAANQYQKRPTMPERLPKTIVNRFTGMLLSQKRKPRLDVVGDEDADAFLKAAFEQGAFDSAYQASRNHGGAMGTGIMLLTLRDGRFSYQAIDPRIVFDVAWADWEKKRPAGILIQYTYGVERIVFQDGKPVRMEAERELYRRIIDEEVDVVFKPVRIGDKGVQIPPMEVESVTRHRLGRFPGVWVQNIPSPFTWDGLPDADGQYQTCVGIDRQISQTDRALGYTQAPTIVYGRDKKYETMGIERDVIITGVGRALNVGLGGDAKYMEISGQGILQAREFAKERRSAVLEATQCIIADPEKVAGAAQSAKAIELIYAPMLEKADTLRVPWGAAAVEMAELTLLMGRAWSKPEAYADLQQPVERAFFRLPQRIIEEPDPVKGKIVRRLVDHTPGTGGVVRIEWPPYFEPTPADVQSEVTSWTTAYNGGLAPLERSAREVGKVLGVRELDEYVEQVVKEHKERAQQLAAQGMGDDGHTWLGEPRDLVPGTDEYDRRMAEQEPQFAELEALEGTAPPVGDAVAQAALTAQVALNGAQVASAKSIVIDVSLNKLPRESGVNMLVAFFGLSKDAAEMIMGEVGRSFTPAAPEPEVEPAAEPVSPTSDDRA